MSDSSGIFSGIVSGVAEYSEFRDALDRVYEGEIRDYSDLDQDQFENMVADATELDPEALDEVGRYAGRALRFHFDEEVVETRESLREMVDSEWKKPLFQNGVIEEDYEFAARISDYTPEELRNELEDKRELLRNKREEYKLVEPNKGSWMAEESKLGVELVAMAEDLGLDIDSFYRATMEKLGLRPE